MDWNSKTRIAGQLREEARPILQAKRPPWPHIRKKGSLESIAEFCQGIFYPDAFSVGSILTDMRVHRWEEPEIYQIWTVNQANQNDWSNENWKKYPIKVIQTATRVWFSDSLSPWVLLCDCPHVVYFFPLNKHFTCSITFHLCGDSLLQSRRVRAYVTDHWSSWEVLVLSLLQPSPVSGGEPKTHFKALQAKATGDHHHMLHEPRLSHNALVCSTLSSFMATHCSILAWEIPLTEKPAGLCMLRGGKELNRTEHAHTNKKVSFQG